MYVIVYIDVCGLCDLVLVLARDVAWDEEQPCFRTLAQVKACSVYYVYT